MTISAKPRKKTQRKTKTTKPKRNTIKMKTGMENPYANHVLPDEPIFGPTLFIDGGTNFMGFSVYDVNHETKLDSIKPVDWGTMYATGKDHTSFHALYKRAADVVKFALDHYIDTIVIESYTFIPGKSAGIFVVPSLISAIATLWYSTTKGSLYCVSPEEWKESICGVKNASKDVVRENGIINFFPPEYMKLIHDTYEEKKLEVEARIGKKIRTEYGEQDCIDSLSMGLYVSRRSVLLGRAVPQPLF